MIGQGILIAGVAVLILGGLSHLVSSHALRQPPVHDGIGGKDTDNLAKGCMGYFAALVLYFIGAILSMVGIAVWVLGG